MRHSNTLDGERDREDGGRRGARYDWRTRLVTLLWIAGTLLVVASASTFAVSRLTATAAQGRFWAEVHENLSLGVEFNLPTWFASMLWGLFGLIAWHLSTADHGKMPWLMVAALGLVASIDEYLMLHDRLSAPSSAVERALGIDLGGATWVLLGVLVAGLVAALLARFVLALPKRTRRDLILGGVLFVSGAVGFEVISSLVFEAAATANWVYAAMMHIEESLEYAGVIVAIRGLLRMRMAGQSLAVTPAAEP